MSFKRILPSDIFVWRALPDSERGHIIALPDGFPFDAPQPTGFPQVDETRLREKVAASIDATALFPERRLSHCAFMDELARLVHYNGVHPARVYAYWMELDEQAFRGAVLVLSGITARQWITDYTRLMMKDLLRRTDLSASKLRKYVYPYTHQSLSNFMKKK